MHHTPATKTLGTLACLVLAGSALALGQAPPAPGAPGTSSATDTPPAGAAPNSPAAPPAPPAVDPTHLQRSPAVLAAPSHVAPDDPALLRLARERDAFELVDHAAHQALQDATRRTAAMHAFIQANGLTSDFARFSRTYTARGAQISFPTAFDRAITHLAARPVTAPTTDLQQLEQAVQVEAAAAHDSFNHLNAARRSVDMLATFLASVNRLGEYQQWAAQHDASLANRPTPLTDPAAHAAAQDRRALQLGWDAAQREQRPDLYPPTPDPGQAVAHGPYASSWWNSYADPYYDLAGYPGRDPSLQPGAPPPDYGSTGAPVDYAWATQGYARDQVPIYPELGPNVVPAFGAFPTGAAGGAGFGGARP